MNALANGEEDEKMLEKYADWLDTLEKSDPMGYAQLMTQISGQLKGQAAMDGQPPGVEDFTAALLHAKDQMSGQSNVSASGAIFEPKFPGNKVMGQDGLSEKKEGIMIDVQPAFVLKSSDVSSGDKVFINFCQSEKIKTFSNQKRLDENGEEQDGIHIPLSLGLRHQVADKSGKPCYAYDVAVNPQVISDCDADKSGTFRNFLCELAINYLDQKYSVKLDSRYKLPRATYKGILPPPQHYIRKEVKPAIEDISSPLSDSPSSRGAMDPKKKLAKQTKPLSKKPKSTASMAHAMLCLFEDGNITENTRLPAAEGGAALSPLILNDAPATLRFQGTLQHIETIDDICVEASPEMLCVLAPGYYPLELLLPYPVHVGSLKCTFNASQEKLIIDMSVDKTWTFSGPDVGSTPWLLAQAIDSGNTEAKSDEKTENMSIEDRFHLTPAASTSSVSSAADPVDEDEELPEDRFHRKDVMSQHILDQRKTDRQQKAEKAEQDRRRKREEHDEKIKAAEAAGKSWQEMYPNEPETTFVDFEDIMKEKRKQESTAVVHETSESSHDDNEVVNEEMRKIALAAAAAWSAETQEMKLQSSLAFELLD